jgi:hypothetical protein
MKKPNTFIIGLPRAGTTSLTYYLRSHPDVFVPEPLFKEPHFFSKDIYPQQVNTLESYLELFQQATDEKIIAEASVFYLFSELACKNIKEFCPEAKLIICLRHPVDFLQSYYRMLVKTGRETESNLRKAIELEQKRKNGKFVPKGVKNSFILRYLCLAKYSKYISKYFDFFGKNQIHFFMFDDFQYQPSVEYKKILDFLSIDPTQSQKIDYVKYNASGSFWAKNMIRKNKILRYWASKIPSSTKEIMATHLYDLGQFLKDRSLSLLNKRKTNEINELSTLRYLHELLFSEIEEIEEISGLNCEVWKERSRKYLGSL